MTKNHQNIYTYITNIYLINSILLTHHLLNYIHLILLILTILNLNQQSY